MGWSIVPLTQNQVNGISKLQVGWKRVQESRWIREKESPTRFFLDRRNQADENWMGKPPFTPSYGTFLLLRDGFQKIHGHRGGRGRGSRGGRAQGRDLAGSDEPGRRHFAVLLHSVEHAGQPPGS